MRDFNNFVGGAMAALLIYGYLAETLMLLFVLAVINLTALRAN